MKLFRKEKKDAGESPEAAATAAPEGPEDQEENPVQEKAGFFGRLRKGLSKTRAGFTGKMDRLFLGKKEIDDELLDELEEILFTSDIGVSASQALIDIVQEKVARRELNNPQALKELLKDQMRAFLDVPEPEQPKPGPGEPLVILVIGVNGVGKTTTIGKLAQRFVSEGKKVLLVAADTFRAAAVEQLAIWGERAGVDVIRQGAGADPSAVVFDGIAAAVSRGVDLVLIDTAGRMHTKVNLMEELQKIHRVAGRKLPGAPHRTWLVVDATTGQNAISQAEMFNQALGVSGLILTKLDGTAKGGIVIGISRRLKIPIRYIGIGEKADDLRPFDASEFVDAIFD
ncbi:MAG: signal recognition particle-docking protein FtsY [Deltaproteobacteria bacterium]|nr:signal recognition particle-docking protein FtsY [Deltaproteobacteria bacterium]